MEVGQVFAKVLLLSLLWISGGYCQDADDNILEQPAPVNVTIFYETLCGDSRRFFYTELMPATESLGDIMNIKYVPFGKAISRPYLNASSPSGISFEFQCQHGPRECRGNMEMSCAENMLDITNQTNLFLCIMTVISPVYAGERCSNKFGINWAPIESCASSNLGELLLHLNGVKTAVLRPRLTFVPTILLEGVTTRQYLPQRGTASTFKENLCLAYGHPHPEC